MLFFRYKCTHEGCDLAFVQKVSLTKHMESHGESRFRCEQCGHKFFRAESLRNHLRRAHGQEETFQCSYCGEWFTDSAGLRKHSKEEHRVVAAGHRPCLLCGEIVAASNVRRHFR